VLNIRQYNEMILFLKNLADVYSLCIGMFIHPGSIDIRPFLQFVNFTMTLLNDVYLYYIILFIL